MRVCYHPDYHVPLPPGHPFPMSKYPALHAQLLAAGLIRAQDVAAPDEAPWDLVAAVHAPEWIAAIRDGTLAGEPARRLGLPWSVALVRRARMAVAGTLLAARAALEDGLAANLAGGTHHAFRERGEGFCVFNDIAIAIQALRAEGAIARALVVDLDVHQGDGTAAIFAGDPAVFTLSVHGARNFPFKKEASTLDVPLPDGTADEAYLAALDPALARAFDEADADLVIYQAGVDVAAGDRFGRFALTPAGVQERDRRVLAAARDHEVPIAIVLGGGYQKTPEATAALHVLAHRAAAEVYGEVSSPWRT